jgi:hypothetical protein
MADKIRLLEDLKYCTCAGCGAEALGESMREHHRGLPIAVRLVTPIVAGRIHGRPYCNSCLRLRHPPGYRVPAEMAQP